MADRRAQKERLRRKREAREAADRASQKRKRMVGYGAGGLVAVFALAALLAAVISGTGGGDDGPPSGTVLPDGGQVAAVKVKNLRKASKDAGCKLRSSKRGGGVADHTDDLEEEIDYDSNPPTHGRHYVEPAEDGAYEESPPVTQLVHNLEHGRIVVWFKPSIPEQARSKLKAMFDDDSYQMVLAPKRDMPYAVAATAWNRKPAPGGTGRLLGCKRVKPAMYDAIRNFRDKHRGNGPEAVP